MTPIDAALTRLVAVLERHAPIAVAVSGGVDSMTLAYIAHRHIDAEMIHAISPAVPAEATDRVRRHAERHGWRLVCTDANEFSDLRYRENPANRCYFCKTNLYERLAQLTGRQIASGANLDDLGDYRPGLIAAAERRVAHPLVEAGIDKQTVRALSAAHGLTDLADLPAQPCLSSRIETGIAIDPRDLAFVHDVELAVRAAAPMLRNVRCRILHAGVRLETDFVEGAVRDAVEAIARRFAADADRAWNGWAPYRRGAAFHIPR
jgi:uncharacterized protein